MSDASPVPSINFKEIERKLALEISHSLKKLAGKGPSITKVDVTPEYVIVKCEGCLSKGANHNDVDLSLFNRMMKKQFMKFCFNKILPILVDAGIPVDKNFADIDFKNNIIISVYIRTL